MKLAKGVKTKSRKSVNFENRAAYVLRLKRLIRKNEIPEREAVQQFRGVVRKRPVDDKWLSHFGRWGRHLGLSYSEVFRVVKAQVRKCRGNIRLKWVHRGLRQGYDQVGLIA
jgi:hypothetical protein